MLKNSLIFTQFSPKIFYYCLKIFLAYNKIIEVVQNITSLFMLMSLKLNTLL